MAADKTDWFICVTGIVVRAAEACRALQLAKAIFDAKINIRLQTKGMLVFISGL
jgi:hypothetical protein